MEHTLDHQKMESAKALADMNMQVSAAKALLTRLEGEEEAYLALREEKAQKRVQEVLEESKELIDQTGRNYDEVKQYADSLTKVAKAISSVYEELDQTLVSFYGKMEAWDKMVEKQHEELSTLKQAVKVQQVKQDNDRVSLENRAKTLETWETKLKDERGTLDRAIERLKQGRI